MRQIVVFGLCAVIFCAATLEFVARHRNARIDKLVAEIAAKVPLSANSTATATQKFDTLRTFINDHSTHKLDDEFYRIWLDEERLLAGFLASLSGERPLAHLDCSTRAGIMESVLNHWGYRTRTVYAYSLSRNLESHTFLDVMNPETGAWETQDPDYDLYWRNAKDKARVTLIERAGDLSRIEPCGRDRCGYEVKSREGNAVRLIADSYLEILTALDRHDGRRFSVHTPRASIGSTQTHKNKKGTYCEVLAKNCRDGFFPIGATP